MSLILDMSVKFCSKTPYCSTWTYSLCSELIFAGVLTILVSDSSEDSPCSLEAAVSGEDGIGLAFLLKCRALEDSLIITCFSTHSCVMQPACVNCCLI